MNKIIYSISLILCLSTCNTQDNTNQENNSAENKIPDNSKSVDLKSKIEIKEEAFKNKVFQFLPELDSSKCESFGGCDCCLSELLLFENDQFVFISSCEGDYSFSKGKYKINKLTISLSFSDSCAIDNYNWARETDTTAKPSFVTFERSKKHESIIKVESCHEVPLLTYSYENGQDYGTQITDITPTKRLETVSDSIKLLMKFNF